jgi:very-short-patch-repair endonuclease
MLQYNKANIPRAKELRKNMTEQERKLWHLFLKSYPIRFLRQKVIDDYIVDFYCSKARLAIELDGSQHYLEKGEEADIFRDKRLSLRGLSVLRIPNNAIDEKFPEVCQMIHNTVCERMGIPLGACTPFNRG